MIDRKPIAPLDSIKAEVKAKIIKDSRGSKSKEAMVAKTKKDYGFKDYPTTVADFYKVVNDSIFVGKWNVEKAKKLTKNMFTIGDKSYNQQDFAKYLSTHQPLKGKEDSVIFVNSAYKDFVEESVIEYEDSKLEIKYPEFKALMKEYRDGILLFELTDEKVWSKAVKDTIGLKEFYENNKGNYIWGERLDASIYTCVNNAVTKATNNLVKKGKLSNDEILKEINKKSQLDLKIESDKFLKNDNPIIDSIAWVKGITNIFKKGNNMIFVNVNSVIPKQPKTLLEARGLITADYQTYLEKNWITELKNKYPVEINKEVFSAIK